MLCWDGDTVSPERNSCLSLQAVDKPALISLLRRIVISELTYSISQAATRHALETLEVCIVETGENKGYDGKTCFFFCYAKLLSYRSPLVPRCSFALPILTALIPSFCFVASAHHLAPLCGHPSCLLVLLAWSDRLPQSSLLRTCPATKVTAADAQADSRRPKSDEKPLESLRTGPRFLGLRTEVLSFSFPWFLTWVYCTVTGWGICWTRSSANLTLGELQLLSGFEGGSFRPSTGWAVLVSFLMMLEGLREACFSGRG